MTSTYHKVRLGHQGKRALADIYFDWFHTVWGANEVRPRRLFAAFFAGLALICGALGARCDSGAGMMRLKMSALLRDTDAGTRRALADIYFDTKGNSLNECQ